MGKESFAKAFIGLGEQVVAATIRDMLMQKATGDSEQLDDAKVAASNTYKQVSNWPIVGPALAPIAAAGAFAGVMAFAEGGIVPGYRDYDSVPAMLTPGEAVLPKGLTDKLTKSSSGGEVHNHHNTMHVVQHVQTIDGDGMRQALDKNAAVLTKHFHSTMRKQNR